MTSCVWCGMRGFYAISRHVRVFDAFSRLCRRERKQRCSRPRQRCCPRHESATVRGQVAAIPDVVGSQSCLDESRWIGPASRLTPPTRRRIMQLHSISATGSNAHLSGTIPITCRRTSPSPLQSACVVIAGLTLSGTLTASNGDGNRESAAVATLRGPISVRQFRDRPASCIRGDTADVGG